MSLEFQFATAWTMELEQDRSVQVLVYLWTVPDDDQGDLQYMLRVKSWVTGCCVGYDLSFPVGEQDKAFKAIEQCALKGSEARVKIEASLHSLLEEGLDDVGR